MKETQSAENWMALSTAYELLSLGLLVPSKETAQALVSGEFSEACSEICSSLGVDHSQAEMLLNTLHEFIGRDCEEVFSEIRREYTRLFVGEKKPPITPYIGLWETEKEGVEGLLFVSQGSIEIEHFMRDRGVAKDLAAGQTNDPVDHIGTVCEFLQYLCLVNARAVKTPDGFEVEPDDYRNFLADYFAPYAYWLIRQISTTSRSSFYKAMALLLDFALSTTSCSKE